MPRHCLKAGAFLVLLASFSFAQVTGRLSGSVVDASGAAIPGAAIQLTLPGGTAAVLAGATTAEGLFSLTGVRPGFYDVSVSAQGFVTHVTRQVKVDPARETVLPAAKLDLAAMSQSVDVTADVQTVQTANSEIASTVEKTQIAKLPILDRYVLGLITTQAGVSSGRGTTVVNGLRSTYANVTLDGINIQDNLFRENGLDWTPNILQNDQVQEVTISTSNTNATVGGGVAQVNFVTPSGGNQFHGAGLWYNRNNAAAAGDFFDNMDGIRKAFLNENIFGGTLGGPIRKDKLFFYGNYEGTRQVEKASQNRTILTTLARQGIFQYKAGGAVRQVDLLQAAGVSIDPAVQKILAQVPTPDRINNTRLGDGLNTGGYSFQAQDNDVRDNITGKVDYIHSPRNTFFGAFLWNRRVLDRNDSAIANDYSVSPKVKNDDNVKLMSGTWRWNPSPTMTNEFRIGANIAPATFASSQKFTDAIITGFIFNNPVNTFRSQGRDTRTVTIGDTATYSRGAHTLQYGFTGTLIRTSPYNDAGITPVYTIGYGSRGLGQTALPGISSTDLNNANNLLASMAGWIDSVTQTFNVTSRNSGYVNGATNRRNLAYNNYAGFAQDTWKIAPRLSLTLGLRYDYFGVVHEANGLFLLPVLQNGDYISTMLSNATLDYAGNPGGRQFYNRDLNNFAPNVGLAWDVFGDGKTAIRAGYSINYVDDNMIAAIRNNVNTNTGLATTVNSYNLGAFAGAPPPVATPALKVPRTFADNFALSATNAEGMPDPNLVTPYVQQWTFGFQHEMKGNIVEVRYVGNHAVKSVRGIDYNQVVIGPNGFLADFQKAQSNGSLALAGGQGFDPSYNPSIPGSQPLPFFNQLPKGGQLTSSSIRSRIQQGRVGDLAAYYTQIGGNGNVSFFPSPYGFGMNVINNYSNSSYNALQLDVRRRTHSGVSYQFNYTFGKVLSDAAGDGQTRFDPFMDNANPKIERARAPFDITHAIKGNLVYELPVFRGHRYLGGWNVGGIMTWQSGTPFSILSARGTVNRDARSSLNTATTLLTGDQLGQDVGFFMTGDGPMFVNPAVINSDGRGVAADGSAPFSRQVFYNPAAGALGTLQRRMFSGPWDFNADMSVQKITHLTERQTIEFRAEATNVFNHPAFYAGDESSSAYAPYFNINQPVFGIVSGTWNSRRQMQFGLTYRF